MHAAAWLLLAITLFVPLVRCSDANCDTSSDERSSIWESVSASLANDFTIKTGFMRFEGASVFGANPSTLYGRYYVGPDIGVVEEGWMLDVQDAVVFFGCTPPPGRYFSWRSYVFFSPYPDPPAILFSSLGDSANQLVFNTSATESAPFNSTAVVVTTADQGTFESIASAFNSQQITYINGDVVPSSIVSMGRNINIDDWFTMLVRYAMPDNAADGAAYLNATFPIYLLRKKEPRHSPQPFPLLPLRNNTMSTSEFYLQSSVEQVESQVTTYFDKLGFTLARSAPTSPYLIDGFQCIAQRTDCIGDNHDAAYLVQNKSTSASMGNESSTDVFVVVGVNHHLAGTGVYSNIGMYGYPSAHPDEFPRTISIGVTDEQYQGSALFFAPAVPNAGLLYAYAFTRNCPDASSLPFCTEVPVSVLPASDLFVFGTRAYLNTDTKTGPNPWQLVFPTILHFTSS